MSNFIDQFSDLSLSRLDNLIELTTRDKIASSGVVPIGDIKYGVYRSGRLLKAMVNVTKHAMVGNPTIMRVVRIGGELSPDRFMDAVTAMHLNDARKTFKSLNIRPGHPNMRRAMGAGLKCVGPNEGMYPVHNPLQALLSFLYAHSQSNKASDMSMFNEPFIEMFGPKTYKNLQDLVVDVPVEDLMDKSNQDIYEEKVISNLPQRHTFIPKLMKELTGVNGALKGELDEILKRVTSKFDKNKQITILDSDFQGSLFDELSKLLPENKAQNLTGGRSVKDMIFNTDLDDSFSELLKVRDFIIDKGKLIDLPYSEGAASFSPQVAEAIYNDDKQTINFEALADLIERLQDLEVSDGERKEINERILGPLKLFLEPDELVVDKVMTIA